MNLNPDTNWMRVISRETLPSIVKGFTPEGFLQENSFPLSCFLNGDPKPLLLKNMRIGILRNNQSETETPDRFVSKSAAGGFLRHLTHERISKYVIRELLVKAAVGGSIQYHSATTPSSNPGRHFIPKLKITPVPQLLPPGLPTTLNLYYPVKDQSSYSKRNFLQLWGCEQDEWLARFGTDIHLS